MKRSGLVVSEEEAITRVYDITQLVTAPKDLPGVECWLPLI